MRRTGQNGAGTIDTLIGAGTTIVGDVNFQGGLHLEGRIEGNITGSDGNARLDVSEAGSIVGEIRVATATVNGSIEGDLHASERLILGARARIDGSVFYRVLEMSAGAKVNGKLVHQPHSEPLALEHRSAQPAADGD